MYKINGAWIAFTIMCAYNSPSKSNQDKIRKSHAMLMTSNSSVYMMKLKAKQNGQRFENFRKIDCVFLALLWSQLMMDSSIGVHSSDNLNCCHIEKYVNDYCHGYRCKKYRYSQPSNCFLIFYVECPLRMDRIQKEMCENGQACHTTGGTPSIARIPTVFAAICHPKEDVSWSVVW